MSSQPQPQGGEVRADLGGIIAMVPKEVREELIGQIVRGLVGLVVGLFKKKAKPTPPLVNPTAPVEWGTTADGGPDDIIPEPTPKRTPTKLVLKLGIQANKERLGHTWGKGDVAEDGFIRGDELQRILSGISATNWSNKFFAGLTLYDEKGLEYLRPANIAYGYAYATTYIVKCVETGEVASFVGHGANSDGTPKDGYENNGTDAIGFGDSRWRWPEAAGFNLQGKFHAAANGLTFEISGEVAGVKSNTFTVRVS